MLETEILTNNIFYPIDVQNKYFSLIDNNWVKLQDTYYMNIKLEYSGNEEDQIMIKTRHIIPNEELATEASMETAGKWAFLVQTEFLNKK